MIRFGTLGAARITPRALIYPCIDEPRATVMAVAARDRERAMHFADFAQIPVVLDNYQEVVEHEKLDAIYNPLPITAHHEWTIKALRAGKHVLCEKSFAANADQAREMAAVARDTGKVVMDAFHYRYHPIFTRAKEIYDSGILGDIEEIDAAFHIAGNGIGPGDIRKQYDTGGGVTMDIGCYPISWVRHITGREPVTVNATAETGPPNVDLMLAAEMTFADGAVARACGDMRDGTPFKAELAVRGSKGSMLVSNPLVPQIGNRISVTVGGETSTETFERRATYSYQLDAFLDAIEKGTPLPTDADDAVKQMQVIDACYRAAGLPIRGLQL